ncbi:hypothetical protein V490_00218 [Pseudogymnoascus sp. VKM F-3557]|nr:hypothetical protein V490_00218 [Pseudogymnoascus sp. VKM F-3557]
MLECFGFEGAYYAVFGHVPISLAHGAKSPPFLTEVELAAILGQHGSLSCSNILLVHGREYQDRWLGALPGVGVIRPGTLTEHKSFGEHNNGIDAEIH